MSHEELIYHHHNDKNYKTNSFSCSIKKAQRLLLETVVSVDQSHAKYRLSRIKDSKEDKKEIGIKVEFPGVQLIVCKPISSHVEKKKTQKKKKTNK